MLVSTPTAQKLPLSQIRLDPTLDRSHFDPEKMVSLTASMKEHGLLNPIAVRARPEGYEIIAGNRRYKAAQALGWTEIDARVYPAETTDVETELLALIDNLQRDDLDPIDQAKAFLRLTREPLHQTQVAIARAVGKSEGVISKTLSLLELPNEVQEILRQRKISQEHGLVLLKLRNDSTKVRFGKLAADKGWSVKELEREISKFLKEGGTKLPEAAPAPVPVLPDPLAKIWPPLLKDPNVAPPYTWAVTYGYFEVPEQGYPNVPSWNFHVRQRSAVPKADLGRWFRGMAAAIGDTKAEEQKWEDLAAKFAPKTDAEIARSEADMKKVCLPRTPAEEAALLALIPKGPAAVYGKIYPPGSFVLEKVGTMSWPDLGITDPAQSIRDLIATLRQLQS